MSLLDIEPERLRETLAKQGYEGIDLETELKRIATEKAERGRIIAARTAVTIQNTRSSVCPGCKYYWRGGCIRKTRETCPRQAKLSRLLPNVDF